MAERSFAREVEDLRLGDGDTFRGEGILAITKALLQSGVAYVGGYQGSPISHLMDVLADAKDVLDDLGVVFQSSANEAAAAAMLGLWTVASHVCQVSSSSGSGFRSRRENKSTKQ